jgi:hypothetical protein
MDPIQAGPQFRRGRRRSDPVVWKFRCRFILRCLALIRSSSLLIQLLDCEITKTNQALRLAFQGMAQLSRVSEPTRIGDGTQAVYQGGKLFLSDFAGQQPDCANLGVAPPQFTRRGCVFS